MKYLADENFRPAILNGLLYQNASLDLVRVQDVGLSGSDDPQILEWAAEHDRVILTHDIRTMPNFAYERLAQNQKMVGMIVMRQDISAGLAIADILLIDECLMIEEMNRYVLKLPL